MALFNAILSGWSTGLIVDDEATEVNGTDPSVAASEATHDEKIESSAGVVDPARAARHKQNKTKGFEDWPDEVSVFSSDATHLVRGHFGLDFLILRDLCQRIDKNKYIYPRCIPDI